MAGYAESACGGVTSQGDTPGDSLGETGPLASKQVHFTINYIMY